ncbi:MAG: DUF1217 domain-containing protein [Alphaproteobacteria bacterium]|jgi:hypothetical protein|nr:DUF1217 domain-containing protein [Alphaproteobacteria bacterium]MDP6516987.1 DUF1217 domain-containing protein [Alphaproteobacteria bacterium]
MVGIIGGGFGGGTGVSALFILQTLKTTRDEQFEQFKNSPMIQRDVQHFLEKAGEVETAEEFLEDRRLLSVALSAFALEDEINFPARIKKVLIEPVDDKESLSNKLLDPRFKEIAEAFAFGVLGVGKLKLNFFRQEVIDKFLTNEFEKHLGELNPAVREAEFFRRKIGDITNTFDILGNAVLRSVVISTLDLPVQIAFQSVDKQKALIDARVDIEDFKDPEFVDKFIQRFLIKKDLEDAQNGFSSAGSGIGNSHLLPLFQGLAGAGGISLNLLV